MNPTNQLRQLWDECFGGVALQDPRPRADALQDWSERRAEHLPLTLELILAGIPQFRYGRTEQPNVQTERVLLLMAGYSEEQLALVIAAHMRAGQCRRVVPFTGKGVWEAIQDTLHECLVALNIADPPALFGQPVIVEPNSPADVFRKVMCWTRDNRNTRPALDGTGGQKPMDAGAAHAASFYGIPTYYLDFTHYDRELRRPYPWSCRYCELTLPDPAFSLARRQRVFSAYESRRFIEARSAMADLAAQAEHSGFFDEQDQNDLEEAREFLDQASAWLRLAYDADVLKANPLHDYFKLTPEKTGDPRQIVKDLLAPERFDLLLQYLVDEYWRLDLQYKQGEYREVVVGCVGVVELAVEALFRRRWFEQARVVAAKPIEWTNVPNESGGELPSLRHWEGKPVAPGALPPATFGPKIKLVRRGRASFTVWAQPSVGGRSADLCDPSPGNEDPRLVADVDIELQGGSEPLLQALSNRHWKESWGDFPNGSWVHARHALAHLRAPLRDPSYATAALQRYVPRFIELLRRVQREESLNLERVCQDDWPRWMNMDGYRRRDRAPWLERKADLRRWLRLDL